MFLCFFNYFIIYYNLIGKKEKILPFLEINNIKSKIFGII